MFIDLAWIRLGHLLRDGRVRTLNKLRDLTGLTYVSSHRSIGLVFGTLYPQFNAGQLGAVFASMAIGCLLGFITSFWQDKLYA